jgi:hypothetical protein
VKLKAGEKLRCSNPSCQREREVTARLEMQSGENLRCDCGWNLRRQYSKPQLRIRKVMAAGGAGR